MSDNNMNLGTMPSTTSNLNVGAENKKVTEVNFHDLNTHSESRGRGGRMDILPGAYNLMKPSNRDTYQ